MTERRMETSAPELPSVFNARTRSQGGKRRPRRAQKACSFCRHRKLKCTGGAPRCTNCEIHGEDCVYPNARPRPRPTNAALERLREENRRLRRQASAPEVASDDLSPVVDNNTTASSGTPPSNERLLSEWTEKPIFTHSNSETTAAVTPGSANTPGSVGGASTYHGPTSTLFDDAAAKRQDRPWLSSEREAWMPKFLLAAAAEQRQMESINARANKLDFDGVDPELGLHLLNLHWNRQHHAYQATYRPAFMRDMACGGPYFSKILLNAIYYGAAKFSPRLDIRKDPNDVRTAGWRFRDRVRDLLGPAMDHSQITTIQALLQMSNSLFALGDEQSASWVYAGTAFRMLIDLGLHVDATQLSNTHLSDEDIEIRRRVFWSAFVIDKMQSLYQGRPASLQATDCQVPIQFMDTYEELEQWQPFAYTKENDYPGSASYSVSTFTQLCKLCIILTDVLNNMYGEKRTNKPTATLVEDLSSLEKQIRDWKSRLPGHLSVDLSQNIETIHIPPPHVLSLLAMWNVLRVLLHRPFVSDGHLQSTAPSIAVSSFVACAEAATDIVKLTRLYDRAFSVRRAPYLIPYATYVAATVHVRIAAKRGSASEAHESLKTCLAVFDQNSSTNWAVRKASIVIKNLMQKMGVMVGSAGGDDAGCGEIADNTARDTTTSIGQSSQAEVDLSDANAFNLEPTLVEGNVPEDLNVEAIIQSFMREQAMTNVAPAPPNSSQSLFASMMPTDIDYNTLSHPMSLGYDDTLFGFNTTDFDWYAA